jgi:hypothetical protein
MKINVLGITLTWVELVMKVSETLPPSFMPCSHIKLKCLEFMVSWKFILECGRKILLILKINYVDYSRGRS